MYRKIKIHHIRSWQRPDTDSTRFYFQRGGELQPPMSTTRWRLSRRRLARVNDPEVQLDAAIAVWVERGWWAASRSIRRRSGASLLCEHPWMRRAGRCKWRKGIANKGNWSRLCANIDFYNDRFRNFIR